MKECSKCKAIKNIERFSPSKTSKSGYKSWCKDCENADRRRHYYENKERLLVKAKIWRKDNPELVKEIKRKTVLKTNYGITIEQWNALLLKQNDCCAICVKHYSEFKTRFAVDHCHKTGKVRGLLCMHCNQALGKFEDSIENLESAIDYLKSNK